MITGGSSESKKVQQKLGPGETEALNAFFLLTGTPRGRPEAFSLIENAHD
jgi:hypothetical protein